MELDTIQPNITLAFADKDFNVYRKIFGILICIGKRNSLAAFAESNMTDNDLPFKIPVGISQQKAWISERRAFREFSVCELEDFLRVQWSLTAPVFERQGKGTKHYDFDDRAVMPFIEDTETEARSGGFGEVWKVVIHPSHHMLQESVSQHDIMQESR